MMDLGLYTVGWICALAKEQVAACEFLDEEYGVPENIDDHDTNDYTLGRIGPHYIAIAVLPNARYGLNSAASVCANMVRSFLALRICLLVGIGGGAPLLPDQDVRLGDVVVSSRVLQYDFGKAIQGRPFQRTGYSSEPPTSLMTAVSGLRSDYRRKGHQIREQIDLILQRNPRLASEYCKPADKSDVLYKSDYVYDTTQSTQYSDQRVVDPATVISRRTRPTGPETDLPSVHYGVVASANRLMKDATVRDQLAKEEGVLCFEMEAAGLMSSFPCLVIRGICDYADTHKSDQWQGYACMTAAAYARDLLSRIPPSRILRERVIAEATMEGIQGVQMAIQDLQDTIDLNMLPQTEGSTFETSDGAPDQFCLPGTRVELLENIEAWGEGADDRPIYWLHGVAGSGKSTISRTVAKQLFERKRLSASFFFKKGEGNRRRGRQLFTTLASQMINSLPYFKKLIADVLRKFPDIASKQIEDQFDRLILDPLSTDIPLWQGLKYVIIIDALDECEIPHEIETILRCFGRLHQTARKLQLSLFLTSRPELPIRIGFANMSQELHHDVVLQDITESTMFRDISLYVKHRFHESKLLMQLERGNSVLPDDWPGETSIKAIVDRSMPLFVVAATICRFVLDSAGDPETRLKQLLSASGALGASKYESIYLPVMLQLTSGRDQEDQADILQRYRQLAAPVIAAAEPLSIKSIAALTSTTEGALRPIARYLHSVMHIRPNTSEPIRLFHRSFRDFLVGSSSAGERIHAFHFEEELIHRDMARQCLRAMTESGQLHQDLCGLGDPAAEYAPHDRLQAAIPPHTSYACRYWHYHLARAGEQSLLMEEVRRFLFGFFPYWLEALAWMKCLSPTALDAIDVLTAFTENHPNREIRGFLDDASQVVLQHESTIRKHPLQLYASVLAFLPQSNQVKATYMRQTQSQLLCMPQVDAEWHSRTRVLEDHTAAVTALAVSPCGKYVASASSNGVIKIWNPLPRQSQQLSDILSGSVTSLAFSKSSKLLAASSGQTVNVFDVMTGEAQTVLEVNVRDVLGLAFGIEDGAEVLCLTTKELVITADLASSSEKRHFGIAYAPVSKVAISFEAGMFASISEKVWNPQSPSIGIVSLQDRTSGQPRRALRGPIAHELSISPDGRLLIIAYVDCVVVIWSLETFEPISQLDALYHYKPGRSQPIACDSNMTATLSSGSSIRLSSTGTGRTMHDVQLYVAGITCLEFAQDRKSLIAACDDGTLRVFDIDRNERKSLQLNPDLHTGAITEVAISPDGRLVASASTDCTVKLWNPFEGALLHTLAESVTAVVSLAFAYDSSSLAFGASNGRVYITGQIKELWWTTNVHVFPGGHKDTVEALAFSNSGDFVASASKDRTIKVWNVLRCTQVVSLTNRHELTFALAVSNDWLLSISNFHRVHIWSLSTEREMGPEELSRATDSVCFGPGGDYVVTDTQQIPFDDGMLHRFQARPRELPRPQLRRQDRWITKDGKLMLHLPLEWQARCQATRAGLVVLGHVTGRITFIRDLEGTGI